MKALQALDRANYKASRKDFKGNQYGLRHAKAIQFSAGLYDLPDSSASQHEASMSTMIKALAMYADAHAKAYNSDLADDHILGPIWLQMVRSLLDLRNGQLGRLDAGLIGDACEAIAQAAGFDPLSVHEDD